MAIKTYRRYLKGLRDELVEAIAECENMGFHHMAADTPEWKHFNRICGWAAELHERCEWYDNTQAAHGRRNPQKVSDP